MAHEHSWQLVESGYVQTWSIDLDETDRTIVAIDKGFSDEGDGIKLSCRDCGHTEDLPEDYDVRWA